MLNSLAVALLIVTVNKAWADPSWTKEPTQLNGKLLTTACKGEGISQSFARGMAIKNCQAFATDYLAEEISINKVSVETEKAVAFHQSVQSASSVKNLKCTVKREFNQEHDGAFVSWVQCQFALNDVQLEKIKEVVDTKEDKPIERYEPDVVLPPIETDGQRLVYLYTQPKCDSVLIYSTVSRVVTCESDHQTIVLKPEDTYFVLRKAGYTPVKVDAKNIKDGEKIEKVLLAN